MFEDFGVQNKIRYGTFTQLADNMMNNECDICKMTLDLIEKNKIEIKAKSPPPRIVLIDELDVFFS
jgi:hypothetical protein